ncbi:MAG: DegT/DnrJ/EryC1/StrS family aminotransferase [Pseudomonadota bacterium]
MHYKLATNNFCSEERQAILNVIESGRYTMGEQVKQFEAAFSKKVKANFSVMVNSGSSANLVAVAALFYCKDNPLCPGDEVIVPAISWATTYYPLHQYGLKLKFIDVDLHTLNMDADLLEAALTPKTKMVIAVNILGNPCELTRIKAFCEKHHLILFEDNCESMGAQLDGQYCGTFGQIGTFSTFFSHHITTMEGGLIVTNNEELYELCLSLRSHGWTRSIPNKANIYQKKDNDLFEAYRFILPGYNVRPIEMAGAIGIKQLQKLDHMVEERRKNAVFFINCFAGDERFILQRENGLSSWFCFTLVLNPKFNIVRSKLLEQLKQSEIEYRIITGGNFLRHDVIKYIDHEAVGTIKNADVIHEQGFFVGNHPYDITKEIQYFHSVISKAMEKQTILA